MLGAETRLLPRAAELELHSDPDTHAVTWEFKPAEQTEDGFRPTLLMERVSVYLEGLTEPVGHRNIVEHINGRNQYVRAAIEALIADGYAAEETGPRSSKLVSLLKPFTASDCVPTASGRGERLRPASPSLRGDADAVTVAALGTKSLDELAAMNARGEL